MGTIIICGELADLNYYPLQQVPIRNVKNQGLSPTFRLEYLCLHSLSVFVFAP